MDSIISRLMKNNKLRSNTLKESMMREKSLYEVDDEDEYTEEDRTDQDEVEREKISPAEEDDSKAPTSGPLPKHSKSHDSEIEDEPKEDSAEVEKTPDNSKPAPVNNPNPLDNQYAVRYKIGDEVLLSYSNGTNSKLGGTIDGYDPEGFYRIKWANGLTTNGITDIALGDMIYDVTESKCVCGSTKFVTENNSVVCDVCGRHIKESINLPVISQDIKKKKSHIRSIPHPMTTAHPEAPVSEKNDMKSSIHSAFSKKLITEYKQPPEYVFQDLTDNLRGEFWTRSAEMIADIEELGYEVLESNSEYLVVSREEDDEDYQLKIPLGGTARTLTLDFDRARLI